MYRKFKITASNLRNLIKGLKLETYFVFLKGNLAEVTGFPQCSILYKFVWPG